MRIGRFAPSPTGPLHAGSLVAALASWLDVRARGPQARWLVRIEDADTERCRPGLGEQILSQLAACGLRPDEEPVWQTRRIARYDDALARLQAASLAYPCGCSRKDIDEALAREGVVHARHGERIYPGSCRDGLQGKAARAWRFAATRFQAMTDEPLLRWTDRRLGPQTQDVASQVGDFVLRRADGPWAYQLAVVVDDADQGVTDVVRGEDLADNTARQIMLQRALGLATPTYLHTPLVLGVDGSKLSKQNGAAPLDTSSSAAALTALRAAARTLGLGVAEGDVAEVDRADQVEQVREATSVADALARWVGEWRALYNPRP